MVRWYSPHTFTTSFTLHSKTAVSFYYHYAFRKLLYKYFENSYYNLILEGESGCGKSSLINIIIKHYYNNNNLINSHVCYISLLRDQGIHFYKNEVKIFINNCINNSYKKIIVIEDVEMFSDVIQLYFYELVKNYKNTIYFILWFWSEVIR